jgi:hypothetical protein
VGLEVSAPVQAWRRRVVIVPESRVLIIARVVDDETGDTLATSEEWETEKDAIEEARSLICDNELCVGVNECREVGE